MRTFHPGLGPRATFYQFHGLQLAYADWADSFARARANLSPRQIEHLMDLRDNYVANRIAASHTMGRREMDMALSAFNVMADALLSLTDPRAAVDAAILGAAE